MRKLAAKVLARSFFDYPMMTFYYPDPNRRTRYLEWYLGGAINYGLKYGQVYTTPNIMGVAVWLPPGQTHLSTWRYIRVGLLLAPFTMGLKHYFSQAMKNEDLTLKIHEEIMPGPHWYLWALAVDPDQQSRGFGTILLQPGLNAAASQRLPCYLETHDERNIPFYKKNGFELVRTEQIPGFDLRFWCLVREPHKIVGKISK
jgi:ribosomal protein S18 acetylase RimI-like enzyme